MAACTLAFVVFVFLVHFTDAIWQTPKVLCAGDNMSKWVFCNQKDHVMQIEIAKYGRDSPVMCEPRVKNANLTRNCGTKDVYDIVRPLCEGKNRCDDFVVNTINFGEVQGCENVRIYLDMRIECIKTERRRKPRPVVEMEEKTKKKTKTIMIQNEKATSHVQFEVQHGTASTSTQVLFITLFLGILSTYCGSYC